MKNNKDFFEFVNRKICFLYSFLKENNIDSPLQTLLLIKTLETEISEKYLSFSCYIPLRLIAEEVIKEKACLSDDLKRLYPYTARKYRGINLLNALLKNTDKSNVDRTYLAFLFKAEKFTVREIRILKRNSNSELKSIINNMEKSSKSRIKRLSYLLSALSA